MNKVLVIAGPTATGKTAVSVKLAKEFSGEVISCDSVQIYKHLNIGSAKPTKEEMEGVPHHMMDFLDPFENFSVADFCALAKEKIDDILKRGKLPILAGGTGLYISSLVDNISFAENERENTVREELYAELEKIGPLAMHEKLSEIDPEAANEIHPNNVKRVIRAIEIYMQTGKTRTEQNKESKKEKSPYDFILCGLNCERELLYERINKRVDIMEDAGLFKEVEELLKMGLSESNQSMQGIGYKEILPYFKSEITKEECLELIKKNSRNYAKRQLTWFKRGNYEWFDCLDTKLYDKIKTYVGEKLWI